jgi:hypothetical protein
METFPTASELIFWAGVAANTLLCGLALGKSLKTIRNTATDLLTILLIGLFSGGFLLCIWLACTVLNPKENYFTGCLVAWLLTGIGPSTILLIGRLMPLHKKM